MMNKFGIYFAYWSNLWEADYLYYIKKASKLGFDILEIETPQVMDMPKYKRDELRIASQDLGVELTFSVGFTLENDLTSEDITTRQKGIEFAKKNLQTVYEMKGKIFSGINHCAWMGLPQKGIFDKRPYIERSVNCIKEVIKTAEDLNILYCIEVTNRFEQFLINTSAEGVDYAKEVGSTNLKLLLDTYHMNIEEDNISEAIITAKDFLGHLHVGESNRKVPGKGHFQWSELFSALKEIDYKNRIVMEPFVKMGGDVGSDIKVWRDLSNNADESQLDLDAKNGLEFIKNKMLYTCYRNDFSCKDKSIQCA